ncbi:oxidoreductase [Halostagnicola kamekurae]|uniref:NAD(P)-dependent dehydrogenase, short-chain alcohol dehydrogenase family n=1 Tax=Halostagnicola kamekurae TaxID=619731 RepID=A0A1I6RSV5_9EURY|nr:oxidoreductase [Halostagnicola kamekurae]SFS67799.1 NAD(P)-dependent dehydrogenase, short-chain alcohol dehydrogenase family [Halostagnicola kamekurae]
MSWTAADVPDQSGRTVVVTGANSGIGFEATRVLADRGATVVMACRSVDRGESAAEEIRTENGPDLEGELVVAELDLADLESVRSFPERFDEAVNRDGDSSETEIDVLVNNAGVMAIPRRETAQGFEMQFGVNHLGHFGLTAVLFDRLASDVRVVTVSSGLHERGEIDFDDLQGEGDYSRQGAYAQSKLANLLFAYELDRRLDSVSPNALSAGVHPGYADTSLQARAPEMDGSVTRKLLMDAANAVLAQSAAKGALPTLYAATASDVQGGEYYGPGGFMNMRGAPERQRSAEQSYDRETARKLWDVSEELTGIEFDLEERADDTERVDQHSAEN